MSSGQEWDPECYERNARFVSDLGAPVVALLGPLPGERVLDLGCGDGVLTQRLVEAGCEVVGIDASPEFVAAASGLGLDVREMDGERLPFQEEFDAVFSNAAMHWMKDQDAVIDGVWRALRPGGRFVAELGGRGCVDRIRRALHAALRRRGIDPRNVDPWVFPGDEETRARLEARGFHVEWIALIPRPTPLPGDVTGWLETFARSFLAALPAGERPGCLEEVREALRPELCDADGRWTADYVRLRFRGVRP